jgi:hypothetical protein
MRPLQHQKIVTKSEQRNRRPTLNELDLLMNHFVNGYRKNSRMVPMHKIVPAAIFETHRQGASPTRLGGDGVGKSSIRQRPAQWAAPFNGLIEGPRRDIIHTDLCTFGDTITPTG